MDSERRNRVVALLATTDQIPAALGRELLAEYDALVARDALWAAKLGNSQVDAQAAMKGWSNAALDAQRLANWIIRHPVPGPEMTEVLDLHDRAFPF